MTSWTDAGALAVIAAGLACVVIAAARRAPRREAVTVALDLWTGAALLRLTGTPDWPRIAAAAAVVAVRQLVVQGWAHREAAVAR